jgi:Trk-type K+ transport system membrane component
LFSFLSILTIEQKPMDKVSFEVMSAMTNTGFSTGITPNLSPISKIWLAILMLVGKIGIISIIYSIFQPKKSAIKYRKESIIVG